MAKHMIPLEYDSANVGGDGELQAMIETLPGKRLRITLRDPYREIIVGAGNIAYGLMGQPTLSLDPRTLFGFATAGGEP